MVFLSVLTVCSCWLSVTAVSRPLRDRAYSDKQSWKRISAGPESPGWWEPFSLETLMRAKDAERKCWWSGNMATTRWKDVQRRELQLQDIDHQVAGLRIDQTGSESVIEMLGLLAAPNQINTNYHHNHHNHHDHYNHKNHYVPQEDTTSIDCTLDELRSKAKRIVVVLRDPLSRIMSGIDAHISKRINHTYWIPKDEEMARKTVNHNFESVDGYIDALRNHSDADGAHKKAMAVTYCHHCLSFMLPVKGYYIRDNRNMILDPDTNFVCACKLKEEVSRVATEWGLQLQDSVAYDMQDNRQTISQINKRWIEEIYADDIAFYKEYCGHTCSIA